MASVAFKFTNQSKFQTNPPTVVDGQIIFVEGNEQGVGKIYMDFHNERRCYTPEYSGGGGGEGEDPDAMKYKGISTTDPTSGTVTIGGLTYTPSLNDVVVYQDKEYLYRDGDNGMAWYELGDENRPTGEIMWDVDED